jgi:hypothetical protein
MENNETMNRSSAAGSIGARRGKTDFLRRGIKLFSTTNPVDLHATRDHPSAYKEMGM